MVTPGRGPGRWVWLGLTSLTRCAGHSSHARHDGEQRQGCRWEKSISAEDGGCTLRHWLLPRWGGTGVPGLNTPAQESVPRGHFGSKRGQKPQERLRQGCQRATSSEGVSPCPPHTWLPLHGHHHLALTQPRALQSPAEEFPLVFESQHTIAEIWDEAEELHWAHGIHGARTRSLGCSIYVQHPRVSQTLLVGAVPIPVTFWGESFSSLEVAGLGNCPQLEGCSMVL